VVRFRVQQYNIPLLQMAENFVTIRKVIRFLRKMLFYDAKSRPVHVHTFSI